MPKAKQLTVWTEDQPGMLGKVASALATKKVNIVAFWAGVVVVRRDIQVDSLAAQGRDESYRTDRVKKGEQCAFPLLVRQAKAGQPIHTPTWPKNWECP